ncbi:membrane-bound acid phosphatase 2 [Trypanosoma grayi]|uniref:membrane-bound acid phosphatase 2 n=1 Tax=Trypanosoma grayi TaxID=71804 RepID=UPI0004F40A92|nr:membrane-bound acid phosphatase 2 [Trypanosoma grayi]KEG13197.1 membrane-bound acid phosphatase 2 [Trypanosoma grayi]
MCRLAVVTILAAVLLAFAADAESIKQVSILHRHGARDEPLVIDGQLVWDYAHMTPNGDTMMLNLGKALRRVYGDFISAFDPSVYDALTGDSDRCIQSAQGVLQALFNQGSDFIPVVKHVPKEVDWLMEFNYNFPNVIARPQWNYAFQNNDALAREMLSEDDVRILAGEFGSWCNETPMLCALFAVDALQCRISNTNTTSETLRRLFEEKLLPIQYGNLKHIYGFNPTDPYAVIGSPAYALAVKIMSDAQRGDKKVYHYSAHDTTVLGALDTFGSIQMDELDPKWFPRFGAVLVVTTYNNGSVSFAYAEPEQEANSSLDYISGLPPVTVRCQAADGKVYVASICPLDDVWRYVNRSKPTVVNRYCYLRPEDRCDVKDAAPSSQCQYYRKHCPEDACGPDAVLDPARGYMCVSVATREKMSHYALSAALAGVIGAATGLLLGILIAFLLARTEAKEELRRLVSLEGRA